MTPNDVAWYQRLWESYVFQNTVVAALVGSAVLAVWMGSHREYWRQAWRQLRQKRLAMVSLGILIVYGLIALLDSVAWRDPALDADGKILHDPKGAVIYQSRGLTVLDRALGTLRHQKERTYSRPMADRQLTKTAMTASDGRVKRDFPPLKYPGQHWLGTDKVGHDVLFACLKGIRTALLIGIVTTLIVTPFAIFFGVMAGYFGGWVDDVIQYIYSTLASIPGILLIASFMLLWDRGLLQLCLILGITSWTGLCRLLRGETLKLRELEYVQAAKALGANSWRIIFRHIVPNLMHIVLISSVLRFSGLVLSEAVLSFLGIGVDPQTASWGNLINDARFELSREPMVWWNILGSFILMFSLILPANLFGDAVRDALDPRLKMGDR